MRRHIQFTLSWLVIASLVIGAFLGGVSVGRHCYELEHLVARSKLADERAQLANERLELEEMVQRLHMPRDRFETESW
jgi:hypothetical protein